MIVYSCYHPKVESVWTVCEFVTSFCKKQIECKNYVKYWWIKVNSSQRVSSGAIKVSIVFDHLPLLRLILIKTNENYEYKTKILIYNRIITEFWLSFIFRLFSFKLNEYYNLFAENALKNEAKWSFYCEVWCTFFN